MPANSHPPIEEGRRVPASKAGEEEKRGNPGAESINAHHLSFVLCAHASSISTACIYTGE